MTKTEGDDVTISRAEARRREHLEQARREHTARLAAWIAEPFVKALQKTAAQETIGTAWGEETDTN